MKNLTLVLGFALLIFNFSLATVIHVPADQPTIQSGINSSTNSDTVLVAPGTYYEHINFNGKLVHLKSESGPESTIISALVSGLSIVLFENLEDSTAILEGFTIQNASSVSQGGAIRCGSAASPTIRLNIFRNNQGSTGGAIYVGGPSKPKIEFNTFYSNYSSAGSGILINNTSTAIISNNTFYTDNIYIHYSSPKITSNIITNNLGYAIVGNSLIEGQDPFIINNDFYNNASGDFFGVLPDMGNIYGDPLFCEGSSNNYYLFDSSPCIGSGENATNMGAFGVGCILNLQVSVAGPTDKIGYNGSQQSLAFTITNIGLVADSYSIVITDTLGWNLSLTNLNIFLNPSEDTTLPVLVNVPQSAGLGEINKIKLETISLTNPVSHDEASAMVTAAPLCGDVNLDAKTNLSDIVYLVNYVFKGGATPCGSGGLTLLK